MSRLVLSMIFFVIGLTGLQAQEAITSSGGNASGVGGSVSYSVGQVGYITSSSTNGSVAQGVQQPYGIFIVAGLDIRGVQLVCSAYPNPTNDHLQLKIESNELRNFSYQLFDISGRILESQDIKEPETTLSLAQHISTVYFLKIIQNNREVKTFKIIKN